MKMEDRLIAVAGVAKSLQQRNGARYIAGLWDVELQYGLSWISANSSSLPEALASRKGGRFPTQARRKPTWTWAPLDSNFTYPKYTRPDGDFSLVSISLEFFR